MNEWKCSKCKEDNEVLKYDIETPNYIFHICAECCLEIEEDLKELLTSKFGYEFS